MKLQGKLKFTHQQDCFVDLPQNWIAQVKSAVALLAYTVVGFRVSCENKLEWFVFLAWSGNVSVTESVEISAEFAAQLGLDDGQEVFLELLHEPIKECRHVKLTPSVAGDWSEIAAHGDFIEDNLLRVIRVVSTGLVFPIWLPSTGMRTICLRILESAPTDSPVLLCLNTIVEIVPGHVSHPQKPPPSLGPSDRTIQRAISSQLPSWPLVTPENPFPWTSFIFDLFRSKITTHEKKPASDSLLSDTKRPTDPASSDIVCVTPPAEVTIETDQGSKLSANLRIQEVFPSPDLARSVTENVVLIPVSEYRRDITLVEDVIVKATLSVVPVPSQQSDVQKLFDVSLRLLGQKSSRFAMPEHVGMTETTMRKLGIKSCDRVKITVTEASIQVPELVRDQIHDAYNLTSKQPSNPNISRVAFPVLYDGIISHISLALSLTPLMAELHPPHSSTYYGLLLCGLFGTGKTTMLADLSAALARWPYLVHSETIQCKFLRGKRPDTLRKSLEAVVQDAVHRQPSVVFLDDLDYLAPNVAVDSEAEVEYAARVAQILVDIQDSLQFVKARVILVSTTSARNLVQGLLVDSVTTSVFQSFWEIPVLDWYSRQGLIRFFCREVDMRPDDCAALDSYADQSEGYVLRDFVLLFKRVAHERVVRNHPKPSQTVEKHSQTVTSADLQKAFAATLPQFKQSITTSFEKLSLDNATWADVGGMGNIKKALKEVFELPIRYPKLYAKCPMRLPRGVLLYGLPGTGKTFLAGVLAKELNIGFIHVRGPELLSKYIGASEGKVRDVFQRAKAGKPCLVFFDEFEAIAPRRGHDSTGVTDRVVNQLLTELDGMESLEGVYVLAATSRPELIDPAVSSLTARQILRPGRIDKCLYCPLPNSLERLEILTSLARKISLHDSVDLTALADATEHFTGADLKSILVEAQLEAVEAGLFEVNHPNTKSAGQTESVSISFRRSLIDDPSPLTVEQTQQLTQQIKTIARFSDGMEMRDNPARADLAQSITNEQLLKALHGKLPSVPEDEIARFERLAEHISRNGVVSLPENRNFDQSPMRVSLA